MNKVKTKNSEGFFGCNQKLKRFFSRRQVISKKKKVFTEILSDFPAEIRNSNVFSGRNWVISPPKKRSSSQKYHKIRCSPQKLRKYRSFANTNLGLDLHSSSPKPVNFFEAQSSLGGAQFSFGGARPRNAPSWRRVCFHAKTHFVPVALSLEKSLKIIIIS